MKQYWTPLARWLGMAKPENEPVIATSTDAGCSTPDAENVRSPWPELFKALRLHAQSEWVPRSQRHAEVSPQQRLEITCLRIRATSPERDAELRQWFSEGDVPQLIQWMARGPWRTPEIERWISWGPLTQIELLPLVLSEQPRSSPYDAGALAARSCPSPYEIDAETQWSAWTPPLEDEPPLPPLLLHIEDALGQRSVQVSQTLVVLGSEKTVRMADGERRILKDQCPVPWEGTTAWFVAVTAHHVSGLHLVLRRHKHGVDCMDAGSTNGTFLQGQRLETGHWHSVERLETLYLGGVRSDPRTHTASIVLRVGHPVQTQAGDRTPLRVIAATAQAKPALLTLRPLSGPFSGPVAVHALPFTVGRDASCDWVIPASYEMVSRQHLVIEAVDEPTQRIKLRDLSRQGLTVSRAGWQGSASEGVWVASSDVITLGDTSRHAGLAFSFEMSTS